MSTEILKELDEIDLSDCDECDENDNKEDVMKNLHILSPSSGAKVGILTNVKHLSICLQKALKTCNHKHQLLIFQEARVSFVCEICDLKEDFHGDGEQEAGCLIEDSTDTLQIEDSFDKDDSCIIVKSPTGRRNSIDGGELLVTEGVILSSSPSDAQKSSSSEGPQEKLNLRTTSRSLNLNQIEVEMPIQNQIIGRQTKIISTSIGEDEEEVDDVDDVEIDQLLMDSPEHNEKKRGREEAETDSEDNGMTVDLQNPDVSLQSPTVRRAVTGSLRLRPLSALLPLDPRLKNLPLPQFTSQKLEAGVNPMILSGPWNTHYERDYSLEECVEETPPSRVDGIPSKSNTNVGTVRFRVVSDGAGEVSRLRLSPVPGAGHQAIPIGISPTFTASGTDSKSLGSQARCPSSNSNRVSN